MRRVAVLSPHRDDAAFSLYLALRKWRQSGVRVSVLNFFTRSNYAPRILETQTDAISFIRKREDYRTLTNIDKDIQILDCDLLDAPIRLEIDFMAVCRPETRVDPTSIAQIATYIRRHARRDLLLAPLSLGGHVDHRAVNEAAIASASHKSHLGFYEDLPYAMWTPDRVLREQVRVTESKIGIRLRPVVVIGKHEVRQKRRAAARYTSQIAWEEAISIARFSLRYGGGERVWIPKHGKSWAFLTR